MINNENISTNMKKESSKYLEIMMRPTIASIIEFVADHNQPIPSKLSGLQFGNLEGFK
jgi:hypothetical protein